MQDLTLENDLLKTKINNMKHQNSELVLRVETLNSRQGYNSKITFSPSRNNKELESANKEIDFLNKQIVDLRDQISDLSAIQSHKDATRDVEMDSIVSEMKGELL